MYGFRQGEGVVQLGILRQDWRLVGGRCVRDARARAVGRLTRGGLRAEKGKGASQLRNRPAAARVPRDRGGEEGSGAAAGRTWGLGLQRRQRGAQGRRAGPGTQAHGVGGGAAPGASGRGRR